MLEDPGQSEVVGHGTARHHEPVVGQPSAVTQHDAASGPIDGHHLTHDDAHRVAIPGEPPTDGGARPAVHLSQPLPDVLRVEPGGRDLVEQWLEGVVVALVDERDVQLPVGAQALQSLDGTQATEAPTHDHDLDRARSERRIRRGRHPHTSTSRVTGPSLTRWTCIIVWNRPVATVVPSSRRRATTASTSGAAWSGRAAATKDGRRPLRVSA